MLKGKRDRDESVSQILRDRANLHRILERTAESATRGENEAQRKLSEMEAEVEIRRWEERSSEVASSWILFENSNLKDSSFIKRIYGRTLLTEKELVCVENGKWGNTLFQESRTKDCREFEELRTRCYEETDKARLTKLDKLSMKQQRNPRAVSQLLAQIRELRDKVKILVWCERFFMILKQRAALERPSSKRYRSTSDSSEYQNSAWPRFWIAAWYTESNGNLRKRFLNDNLLKKEILKIVSKIQRIWHLLLAECDQNSHNKVWRKDWRWDLEQQDSANSKTILHSGGGIHHYTGGTSLGDQSTTAFLKQGCFLIQQDPRSWRQALRQQYSKDCQERLRIPRTHSKAGSDRKERKYQRRISRRTGRVSTYTTWRWRWSPCRFFWSIQGDFICRHHNEPRVQLHAPKGETFPIPLNFFDVTKTAHWSGRQTREAYLTIIGLLIWTEVCQTHGKVFADFTLTS